MDCSEKKKLVVNQKVNTHSGIGVDQLTQPQRRFSGSGGRLSGCVSTCIFFHFLRVSLLALLLQGRNLRLQHLDLTLQQLSLGFLGLGIHIAGVQIFQFGRQCLDLLLQV